MDNNKSVIARNTFFLYFRMLFSMLVSLYTSRVVLNTLGIEDYGINNVVGGVVVMFSFVNSSMSATVQRFLSFEIGSKDKSQLNRVFNVSLIIHICLAILFFIVIETVGIWFLDNKLNIAEERMLAASWVLHFAALSTSVSVLSVPFNALLISKEKMSIFAKISILEVVLRLLIVYLLVLFNFDKLQLYSVLTFLVSVFTTILYAVISRRSFHDCKIDWKWDPQIFKQMLSFAGWNLVGVSSSLAKTQGVNIVLNIFFGTTVNAARGIAYQVNQSVERFVTSFIVALNPQITKSYAAKDFSYMMSLVEQGSRFSFYILLFLSYPILLETEVILRIWLKIVPDYTIIFVQLVLVLSLVEVLSKTLIQLMFSTGDIKRYQIIVGSVTILNLPITIGLYYLNQPPQMAFYVAILLAIVSLFVRLYMLHQMTNLSISSYIRNVIVRVLTVTVVSILLPYAIHLLQIPEIIKLIAVTITSFLSVILCAYYLGMTNSERNFIRAKIEIALQSLIRKIKYKDVFK